MTKNTAPNPQSGQGGGSSHGGTFMADAISVKQIDFSNAGGGSWYSGSGAPGASVGNGVQPSVGDLYFRTDTPGSANQRLYICTVGGGAPTWVGVL